MNQPEQLPEPVSKAFEAYKKRNNFSDNLKLAWDSLNECYYFWHERVYYGIELDGYLHS